MEDVKTSESIQMLGTLWSLFVVYGLWVILAFIFLTFATVLYMKARSRDTGDDTFTTKEETPDDPYPDEKF